MLKADLKAARDAWIKETDDPAERASRERSDFLTWEDSEGRFADFHALRHTYLSQLGRSGASPKVMQMLARHSTVELTIGRYVHAGLFDLSSAVDRLPQLKIGTGKDDQQERQILRATGTDSSRPDAITLKMVAGMVAGPNAKTCDSVRLIESGEPDEARKVDEPQTARIMRNCGSLRPIDKRRGGDSNPRYRFRYTGFRDRHDRPLCHLSECGNICGAGSLVGRGIGRNVGEDCDLNATARL